LGTARAITAVKRLAQALEIPVSGTDITRVVKREAKIQSEIGTVAERVAYWRIIAQLYVPYVGQVLALSASFMLQTRRARNLLRRLVGR
jgi:hypothetical protein